MSLFGKMGLFYKPRKELRVDSKCAICQDLLVDACTVPCGNSHVFCLACLQGVITYNRHGRYFPCPLCRARVRIPLGGGIVFKNHKSLKDKILSLLPKPRCRRRHSSDSSWTSDQSDQPDTTAVLDELPLDVSLLLSGHGSPARPLDSIILRRSQLADDDEEDTSIQQLIQGIRQTQDSMRSVEGQETVVPNNTEVSDDIQEIGWLEVSSQQNEWLDISSHEPDDLQLDMSLVMQLISGMDDAEGRELADQLITASQNQKQKHQPKADIETISMYSKCSGSSTIECPLLQDMEQLESNGSETLDNSATFCIPRPRLDNNFYENSEKERLHSSLRRQRTLSASEPLSAKEDVPRKHQEVAARNVSAFSRRHELQDSGSFIADLPGKEPDQTESQKKKLLDPVKVPSIPESQMKHSAGATQDDFKDSDRHNVNHNLVQPPKGSSSRRQRLPSEDEEAPVEHHQTGEQTIEDVLRRHQEVAAGNASALSRRHELQDLGSFISDLPGEEPDQTERQKNNKKKLLDSVKVRSIPELQMKYSAGATQGDSKDSNLHINHNLVQPSKGTSSRRQRQPSDDDEEEAPSPMEHPQTDEQTTEMLQRLQLRKANVKRFVSDDLRIQPRDLSWQVHRNAAERRFPEEANAFKRRGVTSSGPRKPLLFSPACSEAWKVAVTKRKADVHAGHAWEDIMYRGRVKVINF